MKPAQQWALPTFLQVERVLDIFKGKSYQLEPKKKIIDVFKQSDIAGKLLILGAPGSGKTTMLVELARELIAEIQDDQPVPVLFELSAWKDDKQSITDWLVAELKYKYGVPVVIGKQLLESHQLLALLDGLDELEATRQGRCIEKINQFLQTENRLPQLVVCGRLEEYNLCKTQLDQLNGAVCLQPLTDVQIHDYLKRVKRPKLWQSIKRDSVLKELAASPFLLIIMAVAYEETTIQQANNFDPEVRRQYYLKCLFDTYIQKQLNYPLKSKYYPKKQPDTEETMRWLRFLSKQIEQQSDTEFLIEKMQPSLLLNFWQKLMYSVGVWTISGALGGMFFWFLAIVIIVNILDLNIYKLNNNIQVAISCSILFGIIGAVSGTTGMLLGRPISRRVGTLVVAIISLVYFITTSRVLSDPNVLLIFSFQNNQLFLNIFYGLFTGIFIVLSSGIVGSIFDLYMGIWMPITTTLISKLLGSSSIETRAEIKIVETLSGIKLTTQIVTTTVLLRVGLMKKPYINVRENLHFIFFCIFMGLGFGQIIGLTEGLILGLICLIYTKFTIRTDVLVCKRTDGLRQEQIIRWKKFSERLILGLFLGLACYKIIGIVMGSIFGLILGLIEINIGKRQHQELLSLKLVTPLRNTISLNLIKPPFQKRVESNQGIWKSAFNATISALIGAISLGLIAGLWFDRSIGGFIAGLLFFGLVGGFFTGLFFGGIACIQHFVLRVILWRSGAIPWNYARFLNYAKERRLLERIGGRYRFIHGLLREHFASQ